MKKEKIRRNRVIIDRTRKPREGWEESFRKMAEVSEDAPMEADAPVPTRWDEEEWEW